MKIKIKMLLRIFTLPILTVSLLLQAGLVQAEPNRYMDDQYGYSFYYPQTWEKDDWKLLGSAFVLLYATPADKFATNLVVTVSQEQGVKSLTQTT